jgi:hypothetical protein
VNCQSFIRENRHVPLTVLSRWLGRPGSPHVGLRERIQRKDLACRQKDTDLMGPPDRPDKINQALDQLQGSPGRPFIVRAYDMYADQSDAVHATTPHTPADYSRYLALSR